MQIHLINDDHIIGEYESFIQASTLFEKLTMHYARKCLPFLLNIEPGEFQIAMPSDTIITKEFTGQNEGMTEISPINANIGTITTPNTKSQFGATNEQSEKHSTIDNIMKKYNFSIAEYTNYMIYLHDVFVSLIEEWNKIY